MRSLRQFLRALRAQSPDRYTQLELPLLPALRPSREDELRVARLRQLREQIAAL